MKAIICPTDFSGTAGNAALYAAELASELGLDLVLFHALHVPAVDVYSPANVLNQMMDVQRKAANTKLEAVKEELEGYSCEISLRVDFGFAPELISEAAEELSASLICMGNNGESGALNRFLGGVSYETVKRSTVPVLLIPGEVRFQGWKKVVVANDRTEDMSTEMSDLFHLSEHFHPQMDVITVQEGSPTEVTYETVHKEGGICTVNVQAPEVVQGICTYLEKESASVLAVKRHHRNFLENLLHKSTIKALLGSTHIPVLVFNS